LNHHVPSGEENNGIVGARKKENTNPWQNFSRGTPRNSSQELLDNHHIKE
jgi:hypothetical protein